MVINKIISSIIEIIALSIVPFIWWLVTARKKENFFKWLGFKKVKRNNFKITILFIVLTTIAFGVISIITLSMIKNVETATSEFAGMGISALPSALVYAVLNTSLPEEIFFRGFLLKRLSNKFGFITGNIIQSVIFGLMHGLMFFSLVGIIKAAIIFAITGLIAFSIGYVKKKKAEGSIIPGWTIHALGNTMASVISMFSLI